MTSTSAHALDRIKRIIFRGLFQHRARVCFYGPYATGKARRSSDIDIAVEPLEPIPASLIAGIAEELKESTIPYDIDLVDLSDAAAGFRDRVRKEGIPWTA